jgi:hypothetical protein
VPLRLSKAELPELVQKMLDNLADPKIAETVERAEVKAEEELRRAVSRQLAKKSAPGKNGNPGKKSRT